MDQRAQSIGPKPLQSMGLMAVSAMGVYMWCNPNWTMSTQLMFSFRDWNNNDFIYHIVKYTGNGAAPYNTKLPTGCG